MAREKSFFRRPGLNRHLIPLETGSTATPDFLLRVPWSGLREEEGRQTEEGVKSAFPWSLWNDAKDALLKLSEPHLSPIAPFFSRERDWQLEPHPEGGIILRGRRCSVRIPS